MKKVMIIFGTRPEAIKLAPVIKEVERHSQQIEPIVCVTAQHRGMLDQVLNLFGIIPDYDLNLMKPHQSLFEVTSSALNRLEGLLAEEKPDLVMVQGDTTTAFASALAAFYQRIPVGHVEAGLRTWDKYRPFPEEMNRKLICVLSDVHFAPTQRAKQNLLKENVAEESILVTGNTAIDALLMVAERDGVLEIPGLNPRDLGGKRLLLVTAHRRETFGEHIQEICWALRDIALSRQDVEIVYPVHLNPNVREPVHKIIGRVPNIHLMEPLDYAAFVQLMKRSYLILTDSGGIQEEAPSLNKPVLVLREITERPEAVEAGAVKVIGRKRRAILEETFRLLEDEREYLRMASAPNPFGDGQAAARIVKRLLAITQ